MDYSVFFNQTLTKLGFDLQAVYNCYDMGYDYESGWPLKLPEFDPTPNSLLLLHFQDFFTNKDSRVVELDRVAEHYGQHANQVLVTYWNHGLQYNGPVNTIEFSNHNYDLALALHKRWDEWKHVTEMPKTKAWQCLNGRMCPHRRRAVDVLQTWSNGVLSYGNEIALPEWAYSTYRGTENDDNFIRLADVYGSCAVNIVTETEYNTAPGIVSEKTLMAIAAQQIPIIIGHAGVVQHCKELGFDMFDDLVDISYDVLPNESRLEQALLRNRDLIQGKIDLAPYQERLRRNRKYLLDDFPTWMELRFIRDCERLVRNLLPL
jgi:hypothetical protein